MKILYFIVFLAFLYILPASSQWTVQNSNSNLNITSVCFVNANTGYAVGDNSRFFKTTSGGQSWGSAVIQGVNVNFEANTHRENGSGLATGRNYIFVTTNGGINWIQHTFNPKYKIKSFYEHLNGTVYAAAYEYSSTEDTIVNAIILKTTNYGVDWTEAPSLAIDEAGTPRPKPKKPAIVFTDNNTGYLATVKGIYKTTNGGTSFILVDDRMAWTIDAAGPSLLYAGVTGGNDLLVIRSTNQGASWQQISSIPNAGGSKGFSGMRLLPTANKIYLTVSIMEPGMDFVQQDSSVYASTDNGSTWFFQSLPVVNTNISSIHFIDGNTGWVVGSGGTILKTTNGGGNPVGIQIISSGIPKQFSLSQNYPNPFNPSTKIRFDVPLSAFTKIVIYDITGKEAAVLVNEELNAGKYSAEWNASEYTSGVYFYKLEAGSFIETKKMVLIK